MTTISTINQANNSSKSLSCRRFKPTATERQKISFQTDPPRDGEVSEARNLILCSANYLVNSKKKLKINQIFYLVKTVLKVFSHR